MEDSATLEKHLVKQMCSFSQFFLDCLKTFASLIIFFTILKKAETNSDNNQPSLIKIYFFSWFEVTPTLFYLKRQRIPLIFFFE